MYYCNKSGRPLPPYSVLRNIWTVPNWMIILCKKQVQSLAGQTRRLQIIRNKEEAPASDFASQLRVSPIFSQSQKYSIFFKKYSSKFQSDKNIPCSPLFLFNFLPNTKNIPCSPQFFFKVPITKTSTCLISNAPKKIIIAGFIIIMDYGNNNNNNNAEDQGRCKIGLSLDSKQILHFNGFLLPILTLETLVKVLQEDIQSWKCQLLSKLPYDCLRSGISFCSQPFRWTVVGRGLQT